MITGLLENDLASIQLTKSLIHCPVMTPHPNDQGNNYVNLLVSVHACMRVYLCDMCMRVYLGVFVVIFQCVLVCVCVHDPLYQLASVRSHDISKFTWFALYSLKFCLFTTSKLFSNLPIF